MSRTTTQSQPELFPHDAADSTDEAAVADGYILDFITGEKNLRDTPKEQVRQRIARALFHEYGISVEDMEPDFPVRTNGRRKKIDIAIFHHDQAHTQNHLSRIVICRPEPKVGKNAVRMRDYDQAENDLKELKTLMEEIEPCHYGLWTNGLEFFYLEKEETRFETRFEPMGDWPLADESVGTRDVVSHARTRRAHPDMLRVAFRRCHNFIHGNEGMPKDAAFWQLLYLIFCKMHDERAPRDKRRFWAGPKEQFDLEGRQKIRQRIMPLFAEVKQQYSDIFRGNDEITLSDRALPPFGSKIPITDPNILRQFELAHAWKRLDDGSFRNRGRLQGSVAPEVLFIERCLEWLKPGGRMGIVLPNGILGNPAAEYIRWWILQHAWVLASVDLPVEVFIVEANVNILTSVLFLKKKTQAEMIAEGLGGSKEYPVFMAVAEKVGFDRRGNTRYKHRPDGEEIIEIQEETEHMRIGGRVVERTLRRPRKIVDDDLPVIAQKYQEFHQKYPEPGV